MVDLERLIEVVSKVRPLEDERVIFVDRGNVHIFVAKYDTDGSLRLEPLAPHMRSAIVVEKFGEHYELVSSRNTMDEPKKSRLYATSA